MAPSGDIVVSGIFQGTIDFGGGVLVSGAMENGYDGRMFLARFDAEGNPLWSKKFGKTTVVEAHLAVDASGSVLLGATSAGAFDFGGGPSPGGEDSADIFLARLDPEGNQIWSKRFGGPDWDSVFGVAAGPAGSLIVSGNFEGPVDFGGGVLKPKYNGDPFLARFDAHGNHVFSRSFPQETTLTPAPLVATSPSGKIGLASTFEVPIGLGGTPLTVVGESYDAFAATYDASGHFEWDRSFPCASSTGAIPIFPGFDAEGNLFVAGDFRSTLDLGQTPLVSASTYKDIFVAKLGP